MDSQWKNSVPQQGRTNQPLRAGELAVNEDAGKSPAQPCSDNEPQFDHGRLQGWSVIRAPQNLRVHPALCDLECTDVADELNEAERVKHCVATPILITSDGIILAGFGRWRFALLHDKREISCIEYALGEEESLQFILAYHKPQRGWNAFVRTCLALTLAPYLQRRALKNMQDGGRYKGSAKLPSLQHIDVRREIAEIAGVGARNVSNVKIILKAAHPRLHSALRDGILTINKAVGFCKLPMANQLEAFTQCLEERAIDVEIRHILMRSCTPKPFPDTASVLTALQQYESRFPGSILVTRGRSGRITISASNAVLEQNNPQGELQIDETARSAQ
jgi:hypothetical protein